MIERPGACAIARLPRSIGCVTLTEGQHEMVAIMDGIPGFLDRSGGLSRDEIDDLRRDLLQRQPSVVAAGPSGPEPPRRELTIIDCFACGRSFCDGDGGFCSARCRLAFDAGWPVYQPPVIRYSLPKGRHGFLIKCAGCHEQFDSKGLRCFSSDCEREYQRKQKIEAELAGAASRVVKRKCAADACSADLPAQRPPGQGAILLGAMSEKSGENRTEAVR